MAERMSNLEKRVQDVEEIVGGSPRGEPGLVHTLRGVVKDMYDQVNGFGVLPRIQLMERDKIRMEGQMQGATWMGRILWSIAGSALTYALTHFLKL